MNNYELHMAMHTCHDGCRNPICIGVREAVAAERQRCVDFLMQLHHKANGRHNYYHCAANELLQGEANE